MLYSPFTTVGYILHLGLRSRTMAFKCHLNPQVLPQRRGQGRPLCQLGRGGIGGRMRSWWDVHMHPVNLDI